MKAFVLFSILLALQNAHADIDRKGNGGDICEDRLKIVRDDISSWISRGGAAGLSLPQNTNLATYQAQMLKEISSAHLACTLDKVMVGGVQKTCKNYFDGQMQPQIVCNSKQFMQTSDPDQYILVHHEFSGLAGLEVNGLDGSSYQISNQISEYLQEELVKKLSIRKLQRPSSTESFHLIHFGKGDIKNWSIDFAPDKRACLRNQPPEHFKWMRVSHGWACQSSNSHCDSANCCKLDLDISGVESITAKDGHVYDFMISETGNYWSSTEGAVLSDHDIEACEVDAENYRATIYEHSVKRLIDTNNGTIQKDGDRSCYTEELDLVVDSTGGKIVKMSVNNVPATCP